MNNKICFFTDWNLLTPQSAGNAYGSKGIQTINNIDNNVFQVTSMHASSGVSSAYAACDGLICAQFIDSNLITIILKPSKSISIADGINVKYFIYKGILKSSLIDNSGELLINNNLPFTERVNESWNQFCLVNSLLYSKPSMNVLKLNLNSGSSNFSDSDKLSNLFYYPDDNYQLPSVRVSEKIGVFNSNSFGFEIVIENAHYQTNLESVRELITTFKKVTQNSLVNDSDRFKNRLKGNQILSYIDPAAFYGSFFNDKIYAVSSTLNRELLNGNSFYEKILYGVNNSPNYFNKNRIYLLIKNDQLSSFNSHNQFDDNILIKVNDQSQISKNYYYDEWPILVLFDDNQLFNNDGHSIPFSLRLLSSKIKKMIIYKNLLYDKKILGTRLFRNNKAIKSCEFNNNESDELVFEAPLAILNNQRYVISNFFVLTTFVEEYVSPSEPSLFFPKINFFDMVYQINMDYSSSSLVNFANVVFNSIIINKYDNKLQFHKTAVCSTNDGIYFYCFPFKKRKSLFKFNAKTFSFPSLFSNYNGTFLDFLNTLDPEIDFIQDEVSVDGELIQTLSIESRFKLIDVFGKQDYDDLNIVYFSFSTIDALNSLISNNSFDTDLPVLLSFRRKDDILNSFNRKFKVFEIELNGFLLNSNSCEKLTISSNIKLYSHDN